MVRGDIKFGPCRDWGKKSILIHGQRQYCLEEMGGWETEGGDRNGVFQARGGEIILNQAVVRISQARGQKEPMTQAGIDALTTDVVYLDTRTEEGITRYLDMLSAGGEMMWLQEEEGEEERERAESPSGGKSSGAIAELADAVGLELPESVVGDDEDEEMEDEFLPVQGIPEAAWESLRGLRDSKHASTNDQLGGETWTGEAREEESGAVNPKKEKERSTNGLWEMGTYDSRKAGDVLDDILHNGRNMMKLEAMAHVGEARTLMDYLVMNIDADGLLVDTREAGEDEAGKVVYGWDIL